ncbi:reverse transcriptase (RNA-dependent DNA polymerase) domain-containing protein [Hirsutella rhossiliensis]|uniref:Reverse transcriptase (RNA-dependent DNA polymerase) domain-containing protein n=1 Tax=Hirsutella rhossiliensis TaxID=111463 RepID=A0A9P8MYL1_9HYPO|nr:reverse transcriptase (RNA-dependent DNA polymerase) domain-containing protein [Hirsutella rhossiliensis]KAH0963609.1 reverse transcriptase (RNA-dependent DNA polymerase) domain-containing protein [Hirsutella rhossiliensis]
MGRPRALAFKQAMQSDSAKNWHAAMADEIQSLQVNKTWELTDLPPAAAEDLEIEQMDVKTAFLYGDIDEEVYLEQPEGFEDGTGRVCRLKKAIYGLKQAPRIWFHTITKFLETLGYRPIAADVSVFVRGKSIIAIYVDDLLLTGACPREVQRIKDALSKRFQMTDLGPCSHYLGIKVTRDRARRRIELSQRAYIEKILRTYNMSDCNPTDTPMAADPLQPPAEDWHAPPKDQAAYAKREAIWLRSLMKDLSHPQAGPTAIHEDNKGAIDLANNAQHHSRTKHISLKWHFIREKVAEGTVSLIKIEGTKQPADGLTKALPRDAFLRFRDSLGVKSD